MAFIRLLSGNLMNSIFNPAKQISSPFYQIYRFSSQGENKEKNHPKIYRHNYHEEVEGQVNHQILAEFNAGMVYLSMSCHYGRSDIALPGCQSFFKMLHDEEQRHAMDFIDYQLMRGGQVRLFPITVPEDADWTDITVSLGVAIEMEKGVKEKLECLFRTAEKHGDMQLMDIISSRFMKEQNEAIWELGRLLTRAVRMVDAGGIGRYLFDKEIYKYVTGKSPKMAPELYM